MNSFVDFLSKGLQKSLTKEGAHLNVNRSIL